MSYLSTICYLISLSLPAWAHAPRPVLDSSDTPPREARVEIVEKDGYRVITSNAVPGQATPARS